MPPSIGFWSHLRPANVTVLLLVVTALPILSQPTRAVEFPLLESIAGPPAWTGPGSLVTFGTDGWIAGYNLRDDEGIVRAHLRRSVGGVAEDIPLFGPGGRDTYDVSLGNHDDKVDVVWVKDNHSGQTLRYQRSLTGGATWSASQALTPRNTPVRWPRVARDGAGHVAVVWQDWRRDELHARMSTDGGLSFGSIQTLASGSFIGAPDVAIGGGAIVIAVRRLPAVGAAELIIRRSTTEGRHWSRPRVLITGVRSEVDIEAAGPTVIVAYVRFDGRRTWVAVHRSADAGLSWLPSRLSWPTSTTGRPWYLEVVISERGGIWRAAYERCRVDGCGRTYLRYTRSLDGGSSWADDSPDLVSAMPGGNVPGGVGATAAGPMVLWTNYAEGGQVFRRSAGP